MSSAARAEEATRTAGRLAIGVQVHYRRWRWWFVVRRRRAVAPDGSQQQAQIRRCGPPARRLGRLGSNPRSEAPTADDSSKPKKADGAADGSPWRPPLRRVTVAPPALRAMRAAVDASAPPACWRRLTYQGELRPDLTYLDKKAKRSPTTTVDITRARCTRSSPQERWSTRCRATLSSRFSSLSSTH